MCAKIRPPHDSSPRRLLMRTALMPLLRVASIAASVLLIGNFGCDDTRRTDREVHDTLEESRTLRRKGPDAAQQAQTLLEKAAAQNTSPPTKAHAKAMLARAQMDAALFLINNPENGIEKYN